MAQRTRPSPAPPASEVAASPPRDGAPGAPAGTKALGPEASSATREPLVPLWLLLGLAAAFRLPLLLVTRGTDYGFYLALARQSNQGLYPFLNYWVEYPPVFPWLAVAAYRLALSFPATIRDDFELTFRILLGAPLVAAELLVIAAVYAIAARLEGTDLAWRRAALYAALFWPALVGLGWFDALPAAFLFGGLLLVLRGGASGAGIAAGLGFMTKLFPVLLLPVAMKFLPGRRDRVRVLLGAAIATVAIAAPLWALSPVYFVASYRAILSRSAWETVWALFEGYVGYGRVAPLEVRLDPGTAGFVTHPGRVPTPFLALAFGALYAGLWLRPVARTPRNVVLFAALSTLVLLLYSKGYSPQFIIYLLPFVMLLLPIRRALGYALGLSAVNLLEWPLYHDWLDGVSWVLVVAVLARTALWLALGWEWLAELWELRDPLRAINRRLCLAVAGALLIAVPVAGVAAVREWERLTYDHHALKPAFDFVEHHQAGVGGGRVAYIFTDDELYEQFHPFFGGRGEFALFRPTTGEERILKEPGGAPTGRRDRLATLAGEHERVFLIRKANDWTGRDLNAWLVEHRRLAASLRVGNVDLSVWQPQGP